MLETERGVLREVMATARKAVGEMNRQNEILKKRVAELEASQGSSVGATVGHDEIFQKDLEIQRLQIKVHEQELELRKAKANLITQPRGMTLTGALVDSVPCTITTKWTTDNIPNFDHAEGTVDACRSIGCTTFKFDNNVTPSIPSMAEKVSVLFEIADSARPVAKKQTLTNRSPPRSRHRTIDVSPRSPRGRTNPRYRDIQMPKNRSSYAENLNLSPRERGL